MILFRLLFFSFVHPLEGLNFVPAKEQELWRPWINARSKCPRFKKKHRQQHLTPASRSFFPLVQEQPCLSHLAEIIIWEIFHILCSIKLTYPYCYTDILLLPDVFALASQLLALEWENWEPISFLQSFFFFQLKHLERTVKVKLLLLFFYRQQCINANITISVGLKEGEDKGTNVWESWESKVSRKQNAKAEILDLPLLKNWEIWESGIFKVTNKQHVSSWI